MAGRKEDTANVTDCRDFAYYYAGEGEQYVFYRVPKILFTNDRYRKISTDAKMLYGLMLDRMALSEKNDWRDEGGRLYIYYSAQDIQDALNIGRTKAEQLLAELEKNGLLVRKRQGLCKPNRIYIGRFLRTEEDVNIQMFNIRSSGCSDFEHPDDQNLNTNNTDKNNIELSKIKSIYQESGERKPSCRESVSSVRTFSEKKEMDGIDAMEQRSAYISFFEEQCGFESLTEEYPGREDELQGIKDLLVDTCMTGADTIRISGEDKPAAVVKGQLMKLNIEHIRYVLGCMADNTTKVTNPKAYLLASLYNAPLTMGAYYRSRVNHDLYAL